MEGGRAGAWGAPTLTSWLPCPCPDTPGTTLPGITPTPIHEFRHWERLPAHSPALYLDHTLEPVSRQKHYFRSSSKIFDANPTHISLSCRQSSPSQILETSLQTPEGVEGGLQSRKKPGQPRSQYVISISSPSTPMALTTTTTTQLLNERRCKKKKK